MGVDAKLLKIGDVVTIEILNQAKYAIHGVSLNHEHGSVPLGRSGYEVGLVPSTSKLIPIDVHSFELLRRGATLAWWRGSEREWMPVAIQDLDQAVCVYDHVLRHHPDWENGLTIGDALRALVGRVAGVYEQPEAIATLELLRERGLLRVATEPVERRIDELQVDGLDEIEFVIVRHWEELLIDG